MVRRPSQRAVLTNLGANEVIEADMRLAADLRRAVENVRAVYHICPNVTPDEVEIGRRVLAAAKEAHVDHLVLHSVLHPQTQRMPHHRNKLVVEEALFESGLAFTVLQPTAYMQNLLSGWKLIAEAGVMRNPIRRDSLSLVDLRMRQTPPLFSPSGHTGRLQLTGTAPLTQTEVAESLSQALGRPVRAEAESRAAWEARAAAAGLSDDQRAMLAKMFDHYARHGLTGNPNTLRWLMGREPTTLAEFARRSNGRQAAIAPSSPAP
jgi:uncharacterized protein YbjT (DUF2867 family)